MKLPARLLLSALLALTLLFAQHGAALHALSHLAESLPAQSQQDKQLPHSTSCDKCVVYAGIASAVATDSYRITSESVPNDFLTALAEASPDLAYQTRPIRAPPVPV